MGFRPQRLVKAETLPISSFRYRASGQRPAPSSRDTPRAASTTAGASPRRAARQDALGVADHADRADGVAGVVEDRRRDARLAEHRLVALAREPALAHRLELLAQRARR